MSILSRNTCEPPHSRRRTPSILNRQMRLCLRSRSRGPGVCASTTMPSNPRQCHAIEPVRFPTSFFLVHRSERLCVLGPRGFEFLWLSLLCLAAAGGPSSRAMASLAIAAFELSAPAPRRKYHHGHTSPSFAMLHEYYSPVKCPLASRAMVCSIVALRYSFPAALSVV